MGAAAKRLTNSQPSFQEGELYNEEIIRGVKLMSPRPSLRHAALTSGLNRRLTPFDQGSARRKSDGSTKGGGWWLLFEPELHLGEETLIPDLAGWRVERMPQVPNAAYTTLAPDWVCEVLSPSTRAIDRYSKMPVYAEAGVSWVWLVELATEALEVYELDGGTLRVHRKYSGAVRVRARPFERLTLDLSSLWLP